MLPELSWDWEVWVLLMGFSNATLSGESSVWSPLLLSCRWTRWTWGTLLRSRWQTPVCLFSGCCHGNPRRKLVVAAVILILHFSWPLLPQLTFIHCLYLVLLVWWEIAHLKAYYFQSVCILSAFICIRSPFSCLSSPLRRAERQPKSRLGRRRSRFQSASSLLPEQILHAQFTSTVRAKDSQPAPLNKVKETNWHRKDSN